MNLLVKIWPGLLIFVALAIFSCENSTDIGLGLDPDGVRLNVLYAELPLTATNVRIDSINSSNASRLMIGKNASPIFGTTVSKAMCQLNFVSPVSTSEPLIEELKNEKWYYHVFDSVTMTMNITKVHSDNINPIQNFTVHQLTDTLFTTAIYLSDFNTPYRTDVTEGNFLLKLNTSDINKIDSVKYIERVRLADTFGQKLFAIANEETGSGITPNNTLKYEYKGIAIVGDDNNTALIGLSPRDSTLITLHYHIMAVDTTDMLNPIDTVFTDSLFVNISLGNSSTYYNQITTDRSGSLMAAEKGNYNSFTVGDGNIYAQPASGIYPKVSLDTLLSLFEKYPSIQINRMEFALETTENPPFYSNVEHFQFLHVDAADGAKIDVLSLTNGNLSSLWKAVITTDQGTEPLISPLDDLSLIYTGIPTYFAQLLESGKLEADHLILMPRDVTTPDFSIFDQESGFRIKLYYTLPE